VEKDKIPQQKLSLDIGGKKLTPMEKEERKLRCKMNDLIKTRLRKGSNVKDTCIQGFMHSHWSLRMKDREERLVKRPELQFIKQSQKLKQRK